MILINSQKFLTKEKLQDKPNKVLVYKEII